MCANGDADSWACALGSTGSHFYCAMGDGKRRQKRRFADVGAQIGVFSLMEHAEASSRMQTPREEAILQLLLVDERLMPVWRVRLLELRLLQEIPRIGVHFI